MALRLLDTETAPRPRLRLLDEQPEPAATAPRLVRLDPVKPPAQQSPYVTPAAPVSPQNIMDTRLTQAKVAPQAEQAANDMVASNAQAEEEAMPELATEFGWLDNPFKSKNPEVQGVMQQMVKVWKDEEMPQSDKLARLRKLKQHSLRLMAGSLSMAKAERTALPAPQERMFTESSTSGDVLRTVGSAANTAAGMANALARGVAELPIGVNETSRQWLADNEQEIAERSAGFMEEIGNQGGMVAQVAQEVGQQALTTAIRLAAMNGTGLIGSGNNIVAATKMGLFAAATTSGSAEDRIKAGVRSATMMSTPILAGKIDHRFLAPLADAAMNFTLSNLYGFYDWSNPVSVIPALVMDIAFAATTKPGQGAADRARIMGVVNKARDAFAKAVGGDKASAEFEKAAQRMNVPKEFVEKFVAPVKQVEMKTVDEKPARVELPAEVDTKPTPKTAIETPEGYEKPYEGLTVKPVTPEAGVVAPKEPSVINQTPEDVTTPTGTKLGKHAAKLADHVESKGYSKLAGEIRKNPYNWHKVVGDKQVESFINSLPEPDVRDLAMNTPASDIENRSLSIVASTKLLDDLLVTRVQMGKDRFKAQKEGDTDKVNAIKGEIDRVQTDIKNIETVANTRLSDAGWVLRSAQIGARSSPRKVVNKILAELDEKGYEIRGSTEEKLRIAVTDSKKAYDAQETYEQQFREKKMPTEEGLRELKRLELEFLKKSDKASDVIHAISAGKLSDLVVSNIQGGLLTIKSLMRNLLYNKAFMGGVYYPTLFLKNLQDSVRVPLGKKMGIDAERITSLRSPGRAIKQTIAGRRKGWKQAWRTMLRGYTEGDIVKPMGERTPYVAPIKSIAELWKAYKDPANSDLPFVTDKNGKQHIPAGVAAYKVIEALSGVNQATLRVLPTGDRPDIEGIKPKIVDDIGKHEYKLTGEDLDRFVAAPPKEVDLAAEMEARRVAHQEDNAITTKMNEWIGNVERKAPIAGAALKVVTRGAISPFMKTLVNYTRLGIELSEPRVPASEGAWHVMQATRLYKDNKVKNREKIRQHISKAEDSFGKAAVGVGLGYMLQALTQLDVWKSADYEGKKKTAVQRSTQGQSTLNISGLARAFANKDARQEADDIIMNTLWMSVPGFVMNVQTNMRNEMEKREKKEVEKKTWGEETAIKSMDKLTMAANALLELPIARGGLTIADSIKSNNFGFIEDLMATATSIVMPNVLKDINKIYYKDIRQRRGTGSGMEVVTDRLMREFLLATYPVSEAALGEEKIDELLPKVYSPYTGHTVPAIPREVARAAFLLDPTESRMRDLEPVENGMLEFQKKLDDYIVANPEQDIPDDIYPTVPSKRTNIKDSRGKSRSLAGNRDLLQKINRIHGEEITKAWNKFQVNSKNNPERGMRGDVAAWKAFTKSAKNEFKRRATKELEATVDLATFEGEEYETK